MLALGSVLAASGASSPVNIPKMTRPVRGRPCAFSVLGGSAQRQFPCVLPFVLCDMPLLSIGPGAVNVRAVECIAYTVTAANAREQLRSGVVYRGRRCESQAGMQKAGMQKAGMQRACRRQASQKAGMQKAGMQRMQKTGMQSGREGE